MGPQTPPRTAAWEDEIDLRKVVMALWRRRALIAAGTLACVIVAGIYSFLSPRVYESQALIEVSEHSAPAYGSPAAAAQAINSLTFLEQVARSADLADPRRALQKRVRVEPVPATPFVRLRVRARDPVEAQRLAGAVARTFVSMASERIVQRLKSAEQRLAAVNAQLAEVERILALSRQTLARLQERRPLTGEQEGFVRTFTLSAMGFSESLSSGLTVAQEDLTSELISLQPPAVVEEATLPDGPTAPKPAVNISIGVILGLMASVIGVLVRDAFSTSDRTTPQPPM